MDIAAMVVEKIGEDLERDDLNWDKGRLNVFHPYNPVSKRPYHGINVFTLAISAMSAGYEHPHFMTFNQCKKIEASVKEGEKSTLVVFWKMLKGRDEITKEVKFIPMLRYYRVFNIEQIAGLPDEYTTFETSEPDRLEEPEQVVNTYLNRESLDVVPTFSTPYYSPDKDVIGMPPLADYTTVERYYESFFHEMVHSSGSKGRLNRPLSTSFGAGEYSREELVAEYGAAFLSASTGSSQGFANFAAYIKHWWGRIKSNPKDLVVAAGKGERASEFILTGKKPSKE